MSDDTEDTSEEQKVGDPKSVHASEPITASAAFGALAQLRNMEAQLRWNGFQAAIALNVVGGTGFTLFLTTTDSQWRYWLGIAACVVAIFFNVVHYKILGRDGKFMQLWNEKLTELEQASGIEGGVKIFTSIRYLSLRARIPTIQETLRFCVVLYTLVWAAGGLLIAASVLFFGV